MPPADSGAARSRPRPRARRQRALDQLEALGYRAYGLNRPVLDIRQGYRSADASSGPMTRPPKPKPDSVGEIGSHGTAAIARATGESRRLRTSRDFANRVKPRRDPQGAERVADARAHRHRR